MPNPSFEEYDFCSSFSQGAGWADNWVVPELGFTPDYYNSCSEASAVSVPDNVFGSQEAFTGEAYMGLYSFALAQANSREYVSATLLDSLSPGVEYVVSIHFSLADDVLYSVGRLGMLLSHEIPTAPDSIYEMTPSAYNTLPIMDDKTNWVLFTDTIQAQGGESWLTIGGFFNDSIIDTAYVGNGVSNFEIAYYYVDDVSLIPLDSLVSVESIELIEVDVYPNPTSQSLTLQSKEPLTRAWLTDLRGRRLWALERRSRLLWETDLSSLPRGIYLIEAITEDGRKAVRKVVKL